MSKKIIISVTVILVISLLGLVGYYFKVKSNGAGDSAGKPLTFKNFFPFGGGDSSVGTSTEPIRIPIENTEPKQPVDFNVKLRKVSGDPVAGFGLYDSKLGTTLRHVEKATGHVFETELFSPKQERISNTTNPKVYNAEWGTSSTTFIAQKLQDDNETVDTYSLTLKPVVVPRGEISTSTKYSTQGILLTPGINGVSISGQNLFYITTTENGSTGFVSTVGGANGKQVWNSPIRELLPQFVNNGTIAFTTKPYPGIPGYVYFLDVASGSYRKITGDISGLTTLVSPDAKKVLTLSQSAGFKLNVLTIQDNSNQDLSPATFPEKCAWSKKDANIVYCAVSKKILSASALADWYTGSAQFNDDVWKYDLKAGTSNIVSDLSNDSSGAVMDVIKPALSDNEQYFVFINKIDGTLWSLDLTK